MILAIDTYRYHCCKDLLQQWGDLWPMTFNLDLSVHWKWCCEACGSIVHYTAVNSGHLISFATVSYFPVPSASVTQNNQPSTQVTQNVYEQQQSRNRRWLASFPVKGQISVVQPLIMWNHISQVAFRPPNSAGVNVFSSVNNQFCWFLNLAGYFDF